MFLRLSTTQLKQVCISTNLRLVIILDGGFVIQRKILAQAQAHGRWYEAHLPIVDRFYDTQRLGVGRAIGLKRRIRSVFPEYLSQDTADFANGSIGADRF